ncbi:MAG: PAC2 family protein [Gemmataceae bacterium]|nr:PAC2 family protein [Gemmataceae bacterium]
MELPQLHHPWLVAVWPGMGHVAINAGIYLLAKLGMNALAEFETPDLFDVDQVEVKDGIIQPIRRPRHRLYVWHDPEQRHDLVVFVGEAQPQWGKYAFCRHLMELARKLNVERVFTFAAMATQMHPQHRSRVFGATTDPAYRDELKQLELHLLNEGHIGGLNGVLLAAAAEAQLPGTCLLGEMPHIFAQFPFPKASLAILEVFATIARLDLDLSELQREAERVEQQLGELLARVEEQYRQLQSNDSGEEIHAEHESADTPSSVPRTDESSRHHRGRNGKLSPADREHIEQLFTEAAVDRSKAFELKRELDRLGVFKDYEDRFLDLFKKPSA